MPSEMRGLGGVIDGERRRRRRQTNIRTSREGADGAGVGEKNPWIIRFRKLGRKLGRSCRALWLVPPQVWAGYSRRIAPLDTDPYSGLVRCNLTSGVPDCSTLSKPGSMRHTCEPLFWPDPYV